MDPRSNWGIPISATQAVPRVPLATSAGIRAPLTIDDNDDFEYSESSGGRKGSYFGSFNSDSGFESDGFVSGEDGFETASSSDKVLVADLDDLILEDTRFVREHVVSMPAVKKHLDSDSDESSSISHLGPLLVGEDVSRPIVNSHCGESFDESTSISQLRISRNLLIDPEEELLEGTDSSEEFGEFRPFGANLEEDDAVGTSYGEEGENDSLAVLPIVDKENGLPMKQGIPIAQLSWDTSDDDFVSDDMSWDGSVSGAVRVVDVMAIERSQDTPTIVVDVEKVECSALDMCLPEGNYAPCGRHEGLMPEDSILDVAEDHAADNCDEVSGAEVNEEYEALESNNFKLNSNVSEELGSEQSDYKVEFHDIDDPTNIESLKPSTMEKESQRLNNINLEETPIAGRLSSLGNSIHAADMIQRLDTVEDSVSYAASLVDFMVMERSQESRTVFLDVEKVECSSLGVSVVEGNYARRGCHDGLIVNILENVVGDNILDVTTKNTEGKSDEANDAAVIEEFHGLKSDSFTLTSIPSEKLENDQVVQKNDCEVKFHVVDAPTNIEFCNPSSMERECQSIDSSDLGETQTADRTESLENDSSAADMIQSFVMEEEYYSGSEASHAVVQNSDVDSTPIVEIKNGSKFLEVDFLHYDESLNSDGMDGTVLSEHLLSHSVSCEDEPRNNLGSVDAHIISESEELKALKDPEGTEVFPDQAAILNLATWVGSDATHVMFKSNEGTNLLPLELPGYSGTTNHLLVPAAHPGHRLVASQELTEGRESEDTLTSEEREKLMRFQQLRIKFLRLVRRLNRPVDDTVSAKVLHRLILAAGSPSAQSFSFDLAKQTAMDLEAEGEGQLDFSLNILLIGKSGTGKSATINSLLGEDIATTDPFQPCTNSVKEIKGTVNGLPVRLLDTPGLRSYPVDQSFNHIILTSIKRHMKKFPPDVILYVDRLDMQYEDFNDIPLLNTVTRYLGASIWSKTIVTLTHATSFPPEVSSGSDLSYELFVTRQSQAVQELISHFAGGFLVTNPGAIPVSLVENQAVCEPEENNDMLLPDGSSWREKLLFLCHSLKILSEVDSISRSQLVEKRERNCSKTDAILEVYPSQAGNHAYVAVSIPAYRLLESQFSHPATHNLGFHGWDHGCDDDGANIEDKTDHFPRSIGVQLRKEKKEFTICLNSSRVSIAADFNSKKSRRLSFRINASEDLPMVILGLVPVAKMLFRCIFAQSSER